LAVLALPFAVSAQSCNEQFIPNSTLQDFEDHADGTVTDRRSGLTWARCSAGQVWRGGRCTESATLVDWEGAEAVVRQVNERGDLFYADWRLPTLRELASISEVNCSDPRINAEVFPETATGFYWSASRKLVEGPELAAFTLSYGPEGLRTSRPAERHHVRLVRRADRIPLAEASPATESLSSHRSLR
jgi:hypothetical protein